MTTTIAIAGFFIVRLAVPIVLLALLSWAVSRATRREETRGRAAGAEPAVYPLEQAVL